MVHKNSTGFFFSAVFSLSLLSGFIQASASKFPGLNDLRLSSRSSECVSKVALFLTAAQLAHTGENLGMRALYGQPKRVVIEDKAVPAEDASTIKTYSQRIGYFTVGVQVPAKAAWWSKVANAQPQVDGVSVQNLAKTVAASYALQALLKLGSAKWASRK